MGQVCYWLALHFLYMVSLSTVTEASYKGYFEVHCIRLFLNVSCCLPSFSFTMLIFQPAAHYDVSKSTQQSQWDGSQELPSYRLHLPCRKSIYRLRKRAILQQHLAQKYTSEIRSRSNIIYRISTIQPSSDTLTLKEAFIKIGTLRAPHHRLKFRVSNKRSKLCHLFKLVSHFSSSLTYVKRRGIAQKLWFTSPCRELYNARTGIRAFCNESQHMLRCNNNLRFIEQHARNSSHDASHRRCARPKTDWGEGLEWLRIHQAGIWRTMSS